jgi:4-amino-4-deoxy-L-arabinose transferase-like glycosyltransferase
MKMKLNELIFDKNPWIWKTILALLLLVSFAIRMIGLTDLPLDFHPTRQLYSAIKARSFYYKYVAAESNRPEHDLAISLAENLPPNEPPVMETIVSQTYRITGEHLWVARIYSSLFWVLGGLALFLAAREIASTPAAFISTLIYLFLPYGVSASRSFQPDPLMISLMAYSFWTLLRWQNTGKWKWAILFGLFGGLAILVKYVAFFMIIGAFSGSIIGVKGFRASLRDPKTWVIAALLIMPAASYMFYDLIFGSGFALLSGYLFPSMWFQRHFYVQWLILLSSVTGLLTWVLGVVGVFLAGKRERSVLAGIWIGYILFGFFFAYHFSSHDYYQLPVILIASLSIAPLVKIILDRFFEYNPNLFPHLVLIALVSVVVIMQVRSIYSRLSSNDDSDEAALWETIGDKLGHVSAVASITPDYGYRLAYWGWQSSTAWLTMADLQTSRLAGHDVDVARAFNEFVNGKQYFVVAPLDEFDTFPGIKDLLYNQYPVYAETSKYIIFDIQHPLEKVP